MATPDEGQEFTRRRRMMEKEKDVSKVIRDILLLQVATAHSAAHLLAKRNERLISLLVERSWRRADTGRPTEPEGRLSQYICTGMV